jgi:hypothetical protein
MASFVLNFITVGLTCRSAKQGGAATPPYQLSFYLSGVVAACKGWRSAKALQVAPVRQ